MDGKSLSTSVAQVFNERGQGIILTGGPAEYTKEDSQPHLPADDAYSLLKRALEAYRTEHETKMAEGPKSAMMRLVKRTRAKSEPILRLCRHRNAQKSK